MSQLVEHAILDYDKENEKRIAGMAQAVAELR
jgi:hypothetical protein